MKNLLHEFFNSQSDSSLLNALEQEKLETAFGNWMENVAFRDFDDAARPLMHYLGNHHHPHTSAYVRNDVAELLEGKQSIVTKDYVLD